MKPPELLETARAAARQAYAPYSGFKVGAALLCADGTVFTGCNIENASYGLTNCAERTAVFSAIAAGRRDFVAMAVVADGEGVPYPCGACRQVLSEFCREEFSVYVATADALDDYEVICLTVLLPNRFKLID
ncbi:cytidine deaminase [Tichowtungia aerotolerans]|uniref:Cytidine deaminase n=1 Tax=Tichowtungia aerotolerans TaxID=2697043 RepID=A0A6P1M017_9BACT|nr:cytidine deaminase [Tichowtungia aerotolerans]QHI68139.1 cytidine deaminase [Tichowtungia aerotolerans]